MKLKKLMLMFLAVGLVFATAANAAQPKYVFFFLGDGMASAQIQATEAYLATKYAVENGLETGDPSNPTPGELNAEHLLKPENRLHMSRMPVHGMQTTYDSYALQTDSASAATAFACGLKTRSGVIGMDDTKTTSYKSVAQLAHEQGKKVGILTSVSLDHATPAAYYASVASRNYMNNIATQMAATGYEFFGGGGLASPTGPKKTGDTANNVWELLTANGYEVRNTRDQILALKEEARDKVVCINPVLPSSAAMPYAIDQPPENLSLAEMVEVAIANLYDDHRGRGPRGGGNGFFIMVEGGKIDWACHANDAMAAIGDLLDFDNAIGAALKFYEEHPRETLIVVTGDHETGGMAIGHATTGYKAYYDRLLGQTKSYENFEANEWAEHKAEKSGSVCGNHLGIDNLKADTAMLDLLQSVFGLNYASLNAYQQEKLEDAYDQSMCGSNDNGSDENNLLYGHYNPIIVTITHILNEQASVGWASYSHTGVPVPVMAQGREASAFAGFYDNTDIAKKLAQVMDIEQQLPIQK